MQLGVPPTLVFITVIFGASVFSPSLPPPDASQGNLPQYRCSKAAKSRCSLCSFPSSSGAIPPYPPWGAKAAPRPTAPAPSRRAQGSCRSLARCPRGPLAGLAAAGGRWAGPSPRRGDGGRSRHSGPPRPELPNSHQLQVPVGTAGSVTRASAAGAGTPRGCPESWRPAPALPAAHPPRAISSAEGLGSAPLPSSAPRCAPGRRHRTSRCCPGPAHVNGPR